MEELRFVRFRLKGEPFFPDRPWIRDITSVGDLDAVAAESDVFLIDGEGPLDDARTFLRRVRSRWDCCAKPLFLPASLGGEDDLLADCVVGSLDEALRRGREMNARLTEVNGEALAESRDFRLLAYLFVRMDGEMRPYRYPFTPQIYGYPVADLLAGEVGDTLFWLRTLRDRGLLAQGKLVDRIRFCPKCDGSHLNYVDVCPNCGSIDIVRKEFIHCFTCGRVGASEEFLQENRLRCPFCSTRLRHLGSDYDHPLESYGCNDCGHRFVEADVVVSCLCCGARSRPDELTVKAVHSYRIAEAGKTSARVGSLEDVYALLDGLNYVVPAYFSQLLDWLLLLNRRHTDERFSLLAIGLTNLAPLSERVGRQRTIQLVDAVAGRLRQLIRSTDVTTRTALGTLWLLLPRTDAAGAEILADRIRELRELVSDGSGAAIDFRIARFSSPDDLVEGDNAARITARMAGEIEA